MTAKSQLKKQVKPKFRSPEEELRFDIAKFDRDPLGFALYTYPWGDGDLEGVEGPLRWQAEVLQCIGDHLSKKTTRHQPCKVAVSSGKGIGKAHPLDMEIQTPIGIKKWGDLKVGDELFGINGKPVKIIATKRFKNIPMLDISFSDGSSVPCSTGHLWAVKGRKERRSHKQEYKTGIQTQKINGELYRVVEAAYLAKDLKTNYILPRIQVPHNTKCFRLTRKQKRVKNVELRYLTRRIDSIRSIGKADGMCVQVNSKDGIYLTKDLVPTHNSALVGMCINWGLSTCPDSMIVVTANTDTQMKTKTIPETTRWFNKAINKHWWDVQTKSISSVESNHERIWRCDFIPWSENNPEAFAGLHNKGKRVVVIFDEASAIAKPIWDTTAATLTDEGTELIWLAFGNPTRNDGEFFSCFHGQAHRWKTFQIDSRNVEVTNKKEIEAWKEDYGEDSDYFRIFVKGEFPRAGFTQFIPSDAISRCRKYKATGYELLPKIMAVDVARYGDDRSVIGIRQGRQFRILNKYRGVDTHTLANYVMEYIEQEDPDVVVVDSDGLGVGTTDTLKAMKYGSIVHEFHGGETADDSNKYFNKRAEIWGRLRDAVKAGMEIPDTAEMETDLAGPNYGFSSKQQIQLEKKDDMKKRGIASPDLGDCAAMTFAVRVAVKQQKKEKPRTEYYYPGQDAQGWMGG